MGEVVRQCTAIKRSGDRCKRSAIKGGTVCSTHGGKAPQVLAAAQRRLDRGTALQWAQGQLSEAGTPDLDPLEHIEAALSTAAGEVALFRLARQWVVDQGGSLLGKDRHGQQVIHPYQTELAQAETRWARVAKYALDAGVAQKRVEIKQAEALIYAEALRGTLAALGLSPEMQQKGFSLLGEQLRRLGPAKTG